MSEDRILAIIILVGVMVLIGSGLARRQLAGQTLAKMALLWAAIILLAWAAARTAQRWF